jgi:hypothetical protein
MPKFPFICLLGWGLPSGWGPPFGFLKSPTHSTEFNIGADLRRAVVSIDEIDGQKHGSASYAVNNHTKRNSIGRIFINTNDTLLRLRTDIGYLPDRTEGMEDRGASSKNSCSQSRHEGSILLAVG